MCGGNEVEILPLEIGSEPEPEVDSAMAIAKHNGSIQQGDWRFKSEFPELLPAVESATGRRVNGEVRGLDRGQEAGKVSHQKALPVPPRNLQAGHHLCQGAEQRPGRLRCSGRRGGRELPDTHL